MKVDVEVQQAQALLANVTSRQRAEQKAQWKMELREVRKELREAMRTYDEMVANVKGERELRSILQRRIEHTQELITASLEVRPAVADHLPDDAEVVAWQARHAALENERALLTIQRNAVPQTDLVEASRLRNHIEQLQFSERNLLGLLDGSLGRNREGGLSASRP